MKAIWSTGLYVADDVKKNIERSIERINKGKLTKDIFIITYASVSPDLLEICGANEFLQPYYKDKTVEILGIAGGKDSACELAGKMLEDVYNETGSFDFRSYFSCNT